MPQELILVTQEYIPQNWFVGDDNYAHHLDRHDTGYLMQPLLKKQIVNGHIVFGLRFCGTMALKGYPTPKWGPRPPREAPPDHLLLSLPPSEHYDDPMLELCRVWAMYRRAAKLPADQEAEFFAHLAGLASGIGSSLYWPENNVYKHMPIGIF